MGESDFPARYWGSPATRKQYRSSAVALIANNNVKAMAKVGVFIFLAEQCLLVGSGSGPSTSPSKLRAILGCANLRFHVASRPFNQPFLMVRLTRRIPSSISLLVNLHVAGISRAQYKLSLSDLSFHKPPDPTAFRPTLDTVLSSFSALEGT